jgi:hypothetical protein
MSHDRTPLAGAGCGRGGRAGAGGRGRGAGAGALGLSPVFAMVFAFRDALAPLPLRFGPMANRLLGKSTDYGKSMAYAGCACGSASGLPLRAPAPLGSALALARRPRAPSAWRPRSGTPGPLRVRRGRG